MVSRKIRFSVLRDEEISADVLPGKIDEHDLRSRRETTR
jgi:hypothetical protein